VKVSTQAMFDQSIITYSDKQRPWVYVLGLIGELFAVALAMLVPLIYTEHLNTFGYSHLPLALPRMAPKPVKVETTARRAVSARPFVPTAALYAPTAIPPKPVLLADVIDAPAGDVVPYGTPGAGPQLVGGISDGIPRVSTAPPPPAEKRTKPIEKPVSRIQVGGRVQEAMILRRVIPQYPALARQARVQGTVQLVGVIAKDGTIQQLRVISGHPMLVSAAIEAVRQWVYRPTLLNSEPVEVIAPIEVRFTLGGGQ
jgi:periplasmic protein TonB